MFESHVCLQSEIGLCAMKRVTVKSWCPLFVCELNAIVVPHERSCRDPCIYSLLQLAHVQLNTFLVCACPRMSSIACPKHQFPAFTAWCLRKKRKAPKVRFQEPHRWPQRHLALSVFPMKHFQLDS